MSSVLSDLRIEARRIEVRGIVQGVGFRPTVLRFDSPLLGNALALAGQRGFADKGDNRWLPAERDSLCWPYALAPIGAGGQSMVIVDSGNNRVLLWDMP